MLPMEPPAGTRRSSPLRGSASLPEVSEGSPPSINLGHFKLPTPEEVRAIFPAGANALPQISKEWRLLDSMVVKEPHDDAFRMMRYPTAMQPNKYASGAF